jgi:hypothetical protein
MTIDIAADRLGSRADDVYAALTKAHRGLTAEEGALLNTKLVLLLANLVGDADAVIAAIERIAKQPAA